MVTCPKCETKMRIKVPERCRLHDRVKLKCRCGNEIIHTLTEADMLLQRVQAIQNMFDNMVRAKRN